MVFFRCFDELFSALDRNLEGILKLTDCLLTLSCMHKRFVSFIRPDLLSLGHFIPYVSEKSLAMLSRGLMFQGESKT